MTPDQAQPILDEAEATLEAGDLARAEALFRTLSVAEGLSAHQRAQAEAGLAEAALRSGRPAAEGFLKALHLDPRKAHWYRYRLGEARMKEGGWEAAATAFREALAGWPADERHARAEVLGRLGRARVLAGDRAGEADLAQAIDEDPLHASLYADLGDCLLERRDFAGAGEAYAHACELEPGNADYAAARERSARLAERLARP